MPKKYRPTRQQLKHTMMRLHKKIPSRVRKVNNSNIPDKISAAKCTLPLSAGISIYHLEYAYHPLSAY